MIGVAALITAWPDPRADVEPAGDRASSEARQHPDHHQDEPGVEHRRRVQGVHRRRELVGDPLGERGAGLRTARRGSARVADHERHRDRLAERAAESSTTAAPTPDAVLGRTMPADHLPAGRAERLGAVLELARDGQEQVAAERGDDRQDHHGQHEPGGEDADPGRRGGPNSGMKPSALCKPGSRLVDERDEHDQAPEAVDDARDGREHLDQRADHRAHPRRAPSCSGTGRSRSRAASPARAPSPS